MSLLADIFEPIAEDVDVALNDITVVAFDTDGTLVHKDEKKISGSNFVADQEVSQLMHDLQQNKEQLGIDEVVIISGSPTHATKALQEANLGELIKQPVEFRPDFYRRMRDEGKSVLVVDNDFMLASFADAHVDPQADYVREYLGSKEYQSTLDLI